MTATAARVEVPTGIAMGDLLRLPSGVAIQACRATVWHEAATTRVTLLLPSPGEPPLTVAALAEAAATDTASVVVATLEASGAGQATVVGAVAIEHREAVAMAAAVCAASWGWDESPRICVSLDEQQWVVAPEYRGTTWYATIMEEP